MTLLIIFKKKMSVGENEQKLERCGLLVGMYSFIATVENTMAVLLKKELTYDPEILPLSIYPKELKAGP